MNCGKAILSAASCVAALIPAASAAGADALPCEPGWTHGVVLFGEAKEAKDATPILQRDYRPLHFYGNTLRRQYYRGTPLPAPRDLYEAARVTLTRE